MGFQVIHPREIDSIRKSRGAVLVDVREMEEYREYHFPGARNLPYDSMEVWSRKIPKHKAMILYCDYGSTSLLAGRYRGNEEFLFPLTGNFITANIILGK